MKKIIIDNEKEELKKQIEELNNRWKRAIADYQNLEKRTEAERKEWIEFAEKNLINKLLPVLDILEKAEEHLKDEGLNLAVKQFKDVLMKEGVEEIDSLGKMFDPSLHECVDLENGEDENKIIYVYNKGYFLKGKIIRPAKVKVTKKDTNKKEDL